MYVSPPSAKNPCVIPESDRCPGASAARATGTKNSVISRSAGKIDRITRVSQASGRTAGQSQADADRHIGEGEAPAEPALSNEPRVGRNLPIPFWSTCDRLALY